MSAGIHSPTRLTPQRETSRMRKSVKQRGETRGKYSLLCHTVFESRDYCWGGLARPLADVLMNGYNGRMLKHKES